MSKSAGNGHLAREAAEEHFGHRTLLPGQEETMRALLDGHDVLLVSPTGSGKSLTYQVAGVLMQGCTVVVSPLLALQQDQIEGLHEEGSWALRAARVSSVESDAQRGEALERAASGEVEFLFMSPEQLANPDVLRKVADLSPSLVAVDEAHCVSAWGHDFRPDYFRLGELVPVSDDGSAFPLQSHVRHEEFGDGTVTDIEEDRITVLFDDVGYKTLSLELVHDQGLLERVG